MNLNNFKVTIKILIIVEVANHIHSNISPQEDYYYI